MKPISRRTCLKRTALAAATATLLPAGRGLAAAEAAASPALPRAEADAIAAIAEEVMKECRLPALSFAFAHRGRLAHAAAFGVADRDKAEKVTTEHLFRIASISKPLTSVAVMLLIEGGRLKAGDVIFGKKGLLPEYETSSDPARLEAITIHHLLTHTCGGWGNKANDPMFRNAELNHHDLIAHNLQKTPLENEPGKAYSYSNFGYCILGRVIEKLSGQPYAGHMQEQVFKPCGITDMRITGNTLAERAPNEVIYYPQGKENAYSLHASRMDAHGGWLATPTDLVNFLVRVDGFPGVKDLLKPETVKFMTTGTAAEPTYGCGFKVNDVPNWFHGGSLPGTATLAVRTASGLCWAVYTNTRINDTATPALNTAAALDKMMWRMARSVPEWKA